MPAQRTKVGDWAKQRYDGERHNRGTWEGHWREVAQYVYPEQDDFWQKWNQTSHGERKNQRIYDATAMLANGQFASLLESILIPRAQMWARVTIPDTDVMKRRENQIYLDQLNDTLFRRRYSPTANFQSQMSESFMSIGAFGTGVVYTDSTARGFRYRSEFIGDIYFDLDWQGLVNTVFCRFDYSHQQAIERWGDNAPKCAIKEVKDKPYDRKSYVHAVFPNSAPDPDRDTAEGMPFASVVFFEDDGSVCEEGGYRTMPYSVARFRTSPHEKWGRGPAMSVLPDIRTLNEMARADLRATHKLVDPPMMAYDDGILGAGRQDILLDPGMVNFGGVSADGRPLIQPLQTGARVDLNEAKMEVKRNTIREAFLVNTFQILQQQTKRMTATEVMAWAQEQGQLVGPTAGRIQAEMLGSVMQREIEIGFRRGWFPQPPPDLMRVMAEGDYEFEYESPLSRLQRAEQMVGIDMLIQQGVQLANIGKSDALDTINGQAIMRITQEVGGAPAEALNPAEEVSAMAARRREQEDAQLQAQNAPAAATAIKDLAQAEALTTGA